jgi:hypothetical protein
MEFNLMTSSILSSQKAIFFFLHYIVTTKEKFDKFHFENHLPGEILWHSRKIFGMFTMKIGKLIIHGENWRGSTSNKWHSCNIE